jgi:hypothetical protein
MFVCCLSVKLGKIESHTNLNTFDTWIKLFHFKFKIIFFFFYLVHYCYSGLLNLNVEVILLDSEGLFITNQENGNCNLDYQKSNLLQ